MKKHLLIPSLILVYAVSIFAVLFGCAAVSAQENEALDEVHNECCVFHSINAATMLEPTVSEILDFINKILKPLFGEDLQHVDVSITADSSACVQDFGQHFWNKDAMYIQVLVDSAVYDYSYWFTKLESVISGLLDIPHDSVSVERFP